MVGPIRVTTISRKIFDPLPLFSQPSNRSLHSFISVENALMGQVRRPTLSEI
jgi:hypothetical protein